MNGIEWLDEYHNAVLAELRAIPWVVTAGLYPEVPSGFASPAVFFNVASWERTDQDIGGNLTLELSCEFYILRSFMAGGKDKTEVNDPEIMVRNAALKMSDWIHGRQFGKGMTPAVMQSAEPLEWMDEDRKPYAAWGVTFSQRIAVGQDPFEFDDAPLAKDFWLGIFPDVGATHKDDYIHIAGEGAD